MNFAKWLVAGLIGGAIGAGIWAAVAHFANAEVGWIAWGVGALVGLGVRLAAGEAQGPAPGVTAVVIALLAIVAGKYLAVHLAVQKHLGDMGEVSVSEQDMIPSIADKIAEERVAQGKAVQWPAGKNLENASKKEDYPADVWSEATKQWQALGPEEKQKRMAERKEAIAGLMAQVGGAVRDQGFKDSFGPFDILWFILATFTAFRLGSGSFSSEN